MFPRAKQAALQAMALDPELPRAHGALAHVLVQYEHRYWEGEQEYLRALSLDPADASTWMRLGLVRAKLGRLGDAQADMTRARDLEPMNLAYTTNLGLILYLKRDYAAATRELQRVLELDPSFDSARALLGRVLLAQGDAEGAIREFTRQQRPVPGGDGDLGRAYARAGRVKEARGEIERLKVRADDGYGVAYDLAGIHAALGERDRGLQRAGARCRRPLAADRLHRQRSGDGPVAQRGVPRRSARPAAQSCASDLMPWRATMHVVSARQSPAIPLRTSLPSPRTSVSRPVPRRSPRRRGACRSRARASGESMLT
ncbi:MAG: tetratricopeptide repeat protein [Desulfobacterales bacterium]|nr:tetratricopeptide repeat protein [Desulfobacterales bacterium]